MAKTMNNEKVINEGIKKMEKLIYSHLSRVGQDLAIHALMSAVDAYDADDDTSNLTGNTRYGFASAAFINGKMIGGPYTVMDFDGGGPTSGFVEVGDKGFHDYDSGTWIGSEVDPSVQEYKDDPLKFQPTAKGAKGYELTIEWIKTKYKPPRKGMSIVVANRSPYVDFLYDFRDFDILATEKESSSAKKKIDDAFARHPF